MNGNGLIDTEMLSRQPVYCCPLTLFAMSIKLSRFDTSRPRSRDYVKTGASDVTDMWRRCKPTSQRRTSHHHSDTVRFIAVSRDIERQHDVNHENGDEEGSLSAADDNTLTQLDTLHVIIINVWIFVDVLLLVRRLSLIIVAVRGIHVQPMHYDAVMTSRDCITWPSTVDQSQQPFAVRQNGGPYCVPRPTSDDVIVADVTTSRDLGSPEVVRVLGDVSLVYVALSVGMVCLLVAALCACAALLDHVLSDVAQGSFLLPVSTYFRSAGEFLSNEARHLSAASVTAVEPRYELTSLQHIISVFNTGIVTLTHTVFISVMSGILLNFVARLCSAVL